MFIGLGLLALTIVLRGVTAKNHHIRGKLLVSGAVFAAYAAVAAGIRFGVLDATLRAELGILEPLLLMFGLVNLLVAVIINPWRDDRVPDRFPNIVQDATVVLVFGVAAALILRDRVLAATAAGAVVLGFALQDTLGNLFAGLAIQIEKPFRVGHWVRLGNQDGLVREITWRATKIRTEAGNFIIVPNSALAKDTIINYSEPSVHMRIELHVGAAYESAPNDVRAAILDAIRHEPLLAPDREPEVLVDDFGAYAIDYLIRVWITDFTQAHWICDHVRTSIYYTFRRRGISIPYPVEVQMTRDWSEPAPEPEKLAGTLAATQIFAALTGAQRDALVRTARSAVYGRNEAIVREGDAGSSMFVVAGGEAAVTLGGSAQPVAQLHAGDFFGEMSLLTGDPRSATVTAVTDCSVVELTADGFRDVVMAEPNVADLVCSAVEARRAALEHHRASAAHPASGGAAPKSIMTRMRQFLRL
jgi:small-conductance mechanosensitive channel/CRP-like cAMP-binding protein